MPAELDQDLEKLLVGTNDLRRRTGQAFYHFYRTLIFWADKGLGFFETTQVWTGAGAAIFRLTGRSLRALGAPAPDRPLRAYVGELLRRLAEDLERGDHTRIGHVRWLETRFPVLTGIIRDEADENPVYDADLAELLGRAFTQCARASRAETVSVLREAAAQLAG